MAEKDVLASAAKSASYNMLLQLSLRLLTFGINAVTLHYVSKDMLGVVNVRLFLLYKTVLFLAREAFRRACMSKTPEDKWSQVINLVWCAVPLGIVWAILLSSVWLYMLEIPDPNSVPGYHLGVLAFGASTVIELLSEPLYITAQLLLFVKLKVLAEGIAVLIRSFFVVVLLMTAPQIGIVIFCWGNVLLASTISLIYYGYFTYYIYSGQAPQDFPLKSIRDFFPRFRMPGISWSLSSLSWSFFKQSFLKQLLTEGEHYVMTISGVLNFADQGIYDVINNLGSLAARFIFLPIEDSAYLVFSQTLRRGASVQEQNKDLISLTSDVLESLLKVVTLIGMTILVFGFAYSYLLLDLYGGALLSAGSGPLLLRWYCVYVLLIAINGVSEGFVFATMEKKQVDRYNKVMLGFSITFLTLSWYLTRQLGSIGFVLANCLNMAARITHSFHYMFHYYAGTQYRPWLGLLPTLPALVAYGASFLITAVSENLLMRSLGWLPRLLHVAIGGLCLAIVVGTLYITEYRLIAFIKLQYEKRKGSSHQKET